MKNPNDIRKDLDKQNAKARQLRKDLRKSKRIEKQKRVNKLGSELIKIDSSMDASRLNKYVNNYKNDSYYVGVMKNMANDMYFSQGEQKWKIPKLDGFSRWLAAKFRDNQASNDNSNQ